MGGVFPNGRVNYSFGTDGTSARNKGGNTFVYDRDCGHRHVDSRNRKVSYEDIGQMLEEMLLVGPKKPLHGGTAPLGNRTFRRSQ